MFETEIKTEKALAVAFGRKGGNREEAFEHLDELESLAETAGAVILEKIYQELEKPNTATLIGKGKVEEIRVLIERESITLVIFDDDLSPFQARNLENEFNVKVIDRSGLILDIFAKHARSNEAKTQVDLAQSQYLLPRLTGMWTHLSKQYGGIRTKGPGETQIETDRRALRIKIQRLKEKLKEIAVQKGQQSKGRELLPRFALVGYTNTGKSTLMNVLTDAGVYVEDKLFATLDTTVRAFQFPNGQKALLSDTVGFIRKLPAHLVASFRSTLSEAMEADIIVHIIDISEPNFRDQIRVVEETLEQLKIDKPTIPVFNKIDLLEERSGLRLIESDYPGCIFISAQREINIATLLDLLQRKYDEQGKHMSFVLPYDAMEKISEIYKFADIIKREDIEDGIAFELRIPADKVEMFEYSFGRYM